MNWKVLLTAIVFTLSSPIANSALITYGSYSHDTDTDIVIGDGLEWLQWDVTAGMSWQAAFDERETIYGGGWSIASNAQMASLFTNFDFGIAWDVFENTGQDISTGIQTDGISSDPRESDVAFINMFGDTGHSNTCIADGLHGTGAMFGADSDRDGRVNLARVRDDLYDSCLQIDLEGEAWLTEDRFSKTSYDFHNGVALVREVTPVPEPGTLALIVLGLAGLGITRKRQAAA